MAMGSLDLRLESLGDCYRKLTEDDRQLLTARYRSGLTVEQIAAEMGRSVHSVYRACGEFTAICSTVSNNSSTRSESHDAAYRSYR